MAVFLTKNSQPQRTSPVKRGFWVVHKLLGEHIPPPPPDVAVLPAKETDTKGKTIRQLMALHTTDTHCARCHQRFDPIGLSMEGFDPIGRSRAKDLAGRPIDNVVQLPSGKEARGVPEFGQYLATHRQQDFTRRRCATSSSATPWADRSSSPTSRCSRRCRAELTNTRLPPLDAV